MLLSAQTFFFFSLRLSTSPSVFVILHHMFFTSLLRTDAHIKRIAAALHAANSTVHVFSRSLCPSVCPFTPPPISVTPLLLPATNVNSHHAAHRHRHRLKTSLAAPSSHDSVPPVDILVFSCTVLACICLLIGKCIQLCTLVAL